LFSVWQVITKPGKGRVSLEAAFPGKGL